MQYAYDGIGGRMKEIEYTSGELVALDYDQQRGFPKGESPVDLMGKEDPKNDYYRSVTAMSPRGAATAQLLGNGVDEISQYDDSTGMALMMFASNTGLNPMPVGLTCATAGANASVRCVDYKYDQFSNLAQQTKRFTPSVNGALTGDLLPESRSS